MQSSGGYIKRITFIYVVLLLSQIAFLCFAIWRIIPERMDDFDREIRITDAIIFAVFLTGSYYLFIRYLKRARMRRGVREKLSAYKSGLCIQWLILELLSIISIVSYILTGDFLFIFASIFSITIFFINRPSIDRMCDELELDSNEQRVLKTKDAAI